MFTKKEMILFSPSSPADRYIFGFGAIRMPITPGSAVLYFRHGHASVTFPATLLYPEPVTATDSGNTARASSRNRSSELYRVEKCPRSSLPAPAALATRAACFAVE